MFNLELTWYIHLNSEFIISQEESKLEKIYILLEI